MTAGIPVRPASMTATLATRSYRWASKHREPGLARSRRSQPGPGGCRGRVLLATELPARCVMPGGRAESDHHSRYQWACCRLPQGWPHVPLPGPPWRRPDHPGDGDRSPACRDHSALIRHLNRSHRDGTSGPPCRDEADPGPVPPAPGSGSSHVRAALACPPTAHRHPPVPDLRLVQQPAASGSHGADRHAHPDLTPNPLAAG